MNRAIRVMFILLLLCTPKVFAQEQSNVLVNIIDQQMLNLVDDPQDEQINQDEGYGVDDQEYYEAEGLNAEGLFNEK